MAGSVSPHGKAAQESARRKQKSLCDSQSFPACSLQEATRMLSSGRPQASPPTSHTHTPPPVKKAPQHFPQWVYMGKV